MTKQDETSAEELMNCGRSIYGNFDTNAKITQKLIGVLSTAPNYSSLGDVHKECLHMICCKMSRMVCGDANHMDNPKDIAGYASLLLRHLEK